MNRFAFIVVLFAAFDVKAELISQYFEQNKNAQEITLQIDADSSTFKLITNNLTKKGIVVASEEEFQELTLCAQTSPVRSVDLDFGTLDDRYLNHLAGFLKALPGHPGSNHLFGLKLKGLENAESVSSLLDELKDIPKLAAIQCFNMHWDDTVSFQFIAALKNNSFNALQILFFGYSSGASYNVVANQLFAMQKAKEKLERNITIEAQEPSSRSENSFTWSFHNTAFQDTFESGLLWSIEQLGQKWKSATVFGEPLSSELLQKIYELAPRFIVTNFALWF